MKTSASIVSAAALLCASLTTMAQDVNTTVPRIIDLATNPGCGVTGLTPQQKTERNRRLAEFFFQSYAEAKVTREFVSWSRHDCWAKDATIVVGTLEPHAAPRVRPTPTPKPGQPDPALMELLTYWKALPDFGAVPGTLVVYPWENGATFRFFYEGHTKEGRKVELWEVNTILVNDEGRITHWEFWDDMLGTQDLLKTIYGIDVKGLSIAEYGAAIRKAHEKMMRESETR